MNTNAFWSNKLTFSLIVVAGGVKLMEGVTFLEYSETCRNFDIATNVKLHHWQTYTMKDETIYLQQCGERCLKNMHSGS